MRELKAVEVSRVGEVSITCDKCKAKYDSDDMERQEFLNWVLVGGYGSVWGDGARVMLDLCQHCAYELLSEYVVIE